MKILTKIYLAFKQALSACILFFMFTNINSAQASIVDSFKSDRSDCLLTPDFFEFCGSLDHLKRLRLWISDVQKTGIGNTVITGIKASSHHILIIHSPRATSTAGKTLAELTSALTDGRGSDVVIEMNFDMPDNGTHSVVGTNGDLIPFTARQNLFHEFSHAYHKMNGTWWVANSELQATLDENIYRQQEAALNHKNITRRSEQMRDREDDIQIWGNDI